MAEYKLELKGICKSFPGVKALDNVQLSLRPGTVHALMGENGAGKSTLMKCLFGIYKMDAGEVYLDGQKIEVNNPDEALKPGMNAYLQLTSESEPMLLIPSKALIDSGSEQRVITVDNEGRFVPKIVQVFHESNGVTAIRSGLQEGEKVVASGLFLIDSEANIAGALERMRAQAPDAAASAAHAH